MSNLVYTVYLTDKDGKLHTFSPGSDVPQWARQAIDNPLAWDSAPAPVGESADEHTDKSDSSEEPPPQGGPGASRKVWAGWAAKHNVAVESAWKRDDIIDACKAAGVPV